MYVCMYIYIYIYIYTAFTWLFYPNCNDITYSKEE